MQRRFHKDIHLGNNAITNTCLWSHTGFGVGNEAILAPVFVWRCSALVFATQPCQLSLPKSCTNIHLCREAASTLVFVRKLYQHLSSHWWCTNTYLCNEDVSTFVLGMKLYQQFFLHWWCTIINFCHETTSTLYLYQGHANIAALPLKLRQHSIFAEVVPMFIFAMKQWQHFICAKAMKPRQHSIFVEVVPTFIFAMKPRQKFICIEVMPIFMKPCQYSWSHVNTPHCHWSYVNTLFAEAVPTFI